MNDEELLRRARQGEVIGNGVRQVTLLVAALDAPEGRWSRSEFTSIWRGPDIELIVVQHGGCDESWSWTARGWREPDDDWGSDQWGWVNTTSREAAENAAMRFYMEKDE